MSSIDTKWRDFFLDQSKSIWISWAQFCISFVFFAIGWYLMDESTGTWYWGLLTAKDEIELFFGFIFVSIGLVGLLTSLNRIITYEGYSSTISILLSTFLAAVSIVGGLAIWIKWDGDSWITMDTNVITPVRIVQGFFILCLGIGFFIILITQAIRITTYRSIWGKYNNNQNNNDIESEQNDETQTLTENSNSNLQQDTFLGLSSSAIEYLSVFTYFILILPVLFIFNALLPSDFSQMDPSAIKSWRETKEGYEWTISVEYKKDNYMKFYADIILYYGFIWIVSLVSYVILKNNNLRLSLRKRIFLGYRPSIDIFKFKFVPFIATIGEILFWLLWIVMLIIFIIFWVEKHTYNYTSDMPERQKWARFMGVLSIFFLSCSLFSISRIKLWYYTFGLTQEYLVWYHRIFSMLMIICGYTHFFIWLKFFSVHSEYPLSENNPFASIPWSYEDDNYTPVFMSWFMVFIGSFAYLLFSHEYFRRYFFELFYYIHIIVGFIFVSMLLYHATQSWRYLIPPLILYFWDRVLRFISSTHPVYINELSVASKGNINVTKLSFRTATDNSKYSNGSYNKPYYKIGQYYFINIPCIGLYEWHPFTISSSQNSKELTMHIKDEGTNQFTGKLFNLANDNKINTKNIEIHCDGPYGTPFNASGYDRIALCAGGIGITPCHSIFRTIIHQAYENGFESVPYIHLIWVAQTPEIFEIFDDTFTFLRQRLSQNARKFVVTLRCTRTEELGGTIGCGIEWVKGRYNFLTDLPQLFNDNETKLVFACGPRPLVNDCQSSAYSFGSHFYAESFQL